MALNLSITLTDATFADLAAIVEAAKQAGAVNDTAVTVRTEGEDVTLSIVVDEPTTSPTGFQEQTDRLVRRASEDTDEFIDTAGQISDQVRNTVTTGSDAALRLIAELLKGGPNDTRRR